MPAITYTIPQIIQYAAMTQVLVDRDIRKGNFTGVQYIDKRHSRLLYMERMALIWYNTYGTSPQILNKIGNYVFKLCGAYLSEVLSIISKLTQSLPVITGPSNQSVNVGATATFSISVVSSLPYNIQWYDSLGNLIAGATSLTYSISNAQLSQSGETFFVKVTNAAGVSTSAVATLTVTAVLTGFLSYQASDPAATLQASSDPFTYQESFSITNGQPWVMSVPGASTPNMYIIVKGPIGQPIKTVWNNQGVNTGVIPDLNWHPTLAFGGFQYYYTRLISLDPLQTLTLS